MMGHEMGNFLEPTISSLGAQRRDMTRFARASMKRASPSAMAFSASEPGAQSAADHAGWIRNGPMLPAYSIYLVPSSRYRNSLPRPVFSQSASSRMVGCWFITPPRSARIERPWTSRRGTLLTEASLADDPRIAVRVRTLRIVSLDDRAVGVHVVEVEVEEGHRGYDRNIL